MDEYTYNSYRTNRDLNEQDLELLEQFSRVGAKPANVANILTETRHTNYSTKDANNLLKIVRQKVKCPFNLFYSLLGTYRSYTYGALAPEMTSHVKFPCAFLKSQICAERKDHGSMAILKTYQAKQQQYSVRGKITEML